tara:strand:+ start:944 stop:1132 length:189 start_codon:yes stop_codon:yes gene_type:complete
MIDNIFIPEIKRQYAFNDEVHIDDNLYRSINLIIFEEQPMVKKSKSLEYINNIVKLHKNNTF